VFVKPVLFKIGNVAIHSWGVTVALAFIIALLMVWWDARRTEINPEKTIDFGFWALLAALLGARIIYVLLELPFFLNNPAQIFFIQNGGLSIHGALLGGTIAGLFFARKNKMSFWELADLVAPPLVLAQGIGRIGCFLAGICYGKVSTVPWALSFMGIDGKRHPTQLYEMALDFAIFAFLWARRKRKTFSGEIFLLYSILYSVVRNFVEIYRDNPPVFGSITAAQIAGLPIAVIALVILVVKKRKAN
jgi:phosphatidylglycerol:prolipoprotein diacylglycerol transferase